LFRNIVKPYRKELNNVILQKARDAKIFFHCCGAIFKLIPDLIDSGIHILNPLQPNALGMDPQLIKDTYGDQLCFHGCIDTQIALRGTVADTQAEVNKKINILYRDGGYIVAPANHIMSDVPLENILALYSAVKESDTTKGSL
jgi:uroporphyrinogen decarboxylase